MHTNQIIPRSNVRAFTIVACVMLNACSAGVQTSDGELQGFTPVSAGMYAKGDQNSIKAYSSGEYLPEALPNVAKFEGYAGFIVTYFGERAAAGGCVDRASARKELGHESYLTSGQKPADLTPNGKLAEVLSTKANTATLGVLSFFSGEVNDSTSAQIIVQDVAAQSAISLLDEAKLSALRLAALPGDACDRRIVVNASLTEGIAKTFRSVGKNASASGFNVKVGGKWHNSNEAFERRLYVRIEPRTL